MAEGANVGAIYYTVEADTARIVNSTTVLDNELDKLEGTVKKVDRAVDGTQQSMNTMSGTMRRVARETDGTTSSLMSMHKVLGGILTIQGVTNLIQIASAYNETAERIKMATASEAEYEMVQQRLLRTANGTYRALSEAQEIFIRTADSMRVLGYNTSQSLDVTDSLSYAFVRSATSVDRAKIAMGSFSRSLAKGRVDADAWEMMLIAVPTLAEDMSKALDMTAEKVRRLGADGKLSTLQLTEGLRKSLNENKAAADGMVTTVRDAFQKFSNSLSAYLGESSQVTASTKLISQSVVYLGENIDTLAKIFMSLGAGALARYVAVTGESIIASARAGLAARAQAAEELRLASAHAASTAATLRHAQANLGLAVSSEKAAAASTAATAAAARLATAQAAITGIGARVLGLMGGPVGLIATIATVAAGYFLMSDSSDDAAKGTENVAKSIQELIAQRKALADGGSLVTPDEAAAIENEHKTIKRYEEAILQLVAARGRLAAAGKTDDANSINSEINNLAKKMEESRAMIEELQGLAKPEKPLVDPNADKSEAQKRLKALREELELAKLTGEARARLQAIQRLGTEATAEEREEAGRLGAEIERLNAQHEAQKKATEDAKKAAQENVNVLMEMAQALNATTESSKALAIAKAKMKLNPAATPGEIQAVENMAAALWDAEKAMRAKAQWEDEDAADKIRGSVTPLSGGRFDEQTARFDAEKMAEDERYADQLKRLEEAQTLKIDVVGGYLALEEKLRAEHASRVAQIEQGKNDAILSSGQETFGRLADIIRNSTGKTGAAYKALFAISQGFAIAQATLNLSTAISQAMADPSALTPTQKFANMAAIASAGASLLSGITAISYGGGRRKGGPVSANTMYRVNEEGTPEMVEVGGRQYMTMGSKSGKVTPTSGLGGGGSNVSVSVVINSDGTPAQTASTPGFETFGKDIGNFIDQRFNQLMAKSMQQGGATWNARNGRGM